MIFILIVCCDPLLPSPIVATVKMYGHVTLGPNSKISGVSEAISEDRPVKTSQFK